MLAVGTAVIGSLQFGYNTGVINAPQSVSPQSCETEVFLFVGNMKSNRKKMCVFLDD